MKPAKYIVIGCVKPSFMIRGIKEGSTQRQAIWSRRCDLRIRSYNYIEAE
jgi:hypothetical protein